MIRRRGRPFKKRKKKRKIDTGDDLAIRVMEQDLNSGVGKIWKLREVISQSGKAQNCGVLVRGKLNVSLDPKEGIKRNTKRHRKE